MDAGFGDALYFSRDTQSLSCLLACMSCSVKHNILPGSNVVYWIQKIWWESPTVPKKTLSALVWMCAQRPARTNQYCLYIYTIYSWSSVKAWQGWLNQLITNNQKRWNWMIKQGWGWLFWDSLHLLHTQLAFISDPPIRCLGNCMQRGVEINQLVSILMIECCRPQSEGKLF